MDKDKVIQKQDETLKQYQVFVKWIFKYSKDILESQRGRDLYFKINESESELSVLKTAKEEVKSPYQKEAIKQITDAWAFLRHNNQSIPDDILDLMKDSAIASITGASQFQSVQSKEVQLFMDDVHKWADSAFGTERTALAPLYHLKKEVDEAINAMKDGNLMHIREELADCFILILNSSSKYGLEFKTLFYDAKEKMIKNKARKWGKPDENGVCEHIKDQPVQSVKGECERRKEIEDLMAVVWENAIKCYVEDKPGVKGFLINSGQLETDGSSTDPKSMTVRDVIDTIMQMIGDKHSESKDMYPKEFVEWLGSIHIANSDGDHWIMRYKSQSDSSNWMKTDELYEYWSTVINNKR